jgi:protein gp37
MRRAPHHVFQSLTKAAPQLLKYLDELRPNLWVGVSSPTDWFMGKRLSHKQQMAMLIRSLAILGEVRARTGNLVWLGAEPVSWDMAACLGSDHPLDWAVIGAASDGPCYFQPDADNVRRLLVILDETETPAFYKGKPGTALPAAEPGEPEAEPLARGLPRMLPQRHAIPAVARRQALCRQHRWTLRRSYRPGRDAVS